MSQTYLQEEGITIIGTVKRYSDFRGYGFIKGQDSLDYFVHISQISGDGFRTLQKNQNVEFQPFHSDRGLQARDVHVITRNLLESKEKDISTVKMKKNPFTPQDPVINPHKFAGRRESFINAIDALYNNKNVLVSGPRGIGKSSMSYQLLYLTQGETTMLERLRIDLSGYTFDYIAGDHCCVPGDSLVNISESLLSKLQNSLGQHKKIKESKLSFSFNFAFLKGGIDNTYQPITSSQLSNWFVGQVQKLLSSVSLFTNGVCFLIDEVDVLEDKVDIAPFLKATLEGFRLHGINNVSFIVSGVTGVTTSLISQHQSSTRLFEILELERMTDSELKEIIDLTLDGSGVLIAESAKNQILQLSNRFPQPIQHLGYHAFKFDSDTIINVDDVESAKRLIVQNIRRQEFDSRLEKLGRGAMADILRQFALAKLETINLSYLMNGISKMSLDEIAGNIGELEKRGIVEKQHKGIYRLREPLFKVYLRWVFGIDNVDNTLM